VVPSEEENMSAASPESVTCEARCGRCEKHWLRERSTHSGCERGGGTEHASEHGAFRGLLSASVVLLATEAFTKPPRMMIVAPPPGIWSEDASVSVMVLVSAQGALVLCAMVRTKNVVPNTAIGRSMSAVRVVTSAGYAAPSRCRRSGTSAGDTATCQGGGLRVEGWGLGVGG